MCPYQRWPFVILTTVLLPKHIAITFRFFFILHVVNDRFRTRNNTSSNLTAILPRRAWLFIKPDDVWKIAYCIYYVHVRRTRITRTKIINHKTTKRHSSCRIMDVLIGFYPTIVRIIWRLHRTRVHGVLVNVFHPKRPSWFGSRFRLDTLGSIKNKCYGTCTIRSV